VGPAPYPVDEEYPSVSPYPAADDYPAAAPYPGDDAYPVDEPYPVAEPYPGAEEEDSSYPVLDAYPATSSYPDTSDVAPTAGDGPDPSYPVVGPQVAPEPQPVRKTIKVDKDVVAFLPSHLRKRKRQPPTKTVQPKTKKKTVVLKQADGDAGDDYNQFMEEIEGL
jgi:hypothetical protein